MNKHKVGDVFELEFSGDKVVILEVWPQYKMNKSLTFNTGLVVNPNVGKSSPYNLTNLCIANGFRRIGNLGPNSRMLKVLYGNE